MTELRWYARSVVLSACALIISAVWLFFNITNTVINFGFSKVIMLALSAVTTTGLYFVTNYLELKASIRENQITEETKKKIESLEPN